MRVKKRASKRLGTKQREKVKRKVREHHRKSRKEAKKDVTWRSKKRQDPGIPNNYPYKEQLLNEIEQRRSQAEQERLAAKEARKNGMKEAEMIEGEMEEEEAIENNDEEIKEKQQASTSADVLPISYNDSLNTFLSDTLARDADPNVILTIMVLDARIPFKWRVEKVEEQIKKSGCPLIYAISRSDLVPREELMAYSAQLAIKYPLFPICSPASAKNGNPARQAGGITSLVAHIEKKVNAAKSKSKKVPAIAIVGIENAGRTCLANILASSLPEVTVLDTPGIVLATSRLAHPDDVDLAEEEGGESEYSNEEEEERNSKIRDREAASRLLIRNAGSIFKIREPLPLIDALMDLVADQKDLMMNYNTPAFVDANDFLIGVARSFGHLKKGAIPDTIAAARTVLHQWSTGFVGYYNVEPKQFSTDQTQMDTYSLQVQNLQTIIEADESLSQICLPRKQWRKKWKGKEIRLRPTSDSMLGLQPKLAFVRTEDEDEQEGESEEDNEDEDEDEDVEFDEEDEDDEEDDEEDDDDDE